MAVLLGVPSARAVSNDPLAGVHHPVSTHSGAAQHEFDNGLLLLYAFNPEEAIYHFQAAVQRDPRLAMAYWGIAVAAGPNVNTNYDLDRARIGAEAAAQARSLAANASPEERAYIDAVSLRYTARSQAQILSAELAYAQAMDALARRYPNDLDASTLAAESYMDLTPLDMWQRDGRPTQYTHHVIALLEGVLRRDPAHVGANHYLIHAYEDSPTPGAALASARRLAALPLPPAAEHLAHMPEHIFLRTGQYAEANAAGERAVALFRTYLTQQHANVHDGYFHHDLQMLEYGEMMAGNWGKAHAAASEAAAQVNDSAAEVECFLRFRRDRELLALPAPSVPDVRWHFARALAEARTGDVSSSRAELQAIANNREPQGQIARDLVVAELDARARRDDAAIAALRDAVHVQDALSSAEPPRWYYPVRESLGARLLLAHHDAEAAAVFEADLRRNPGNPRSLFGLAAALAHDDPARSRRTQAEFARAWRNADSKISVATL